MLNPNSGGLDDDFPVHFGVIVRFQPIISVPYFCCVFFEGSINAPQRFSTIFQKLYRPTKNTEGIFGEVKVLEQYTSKKSSFLPQKILKETCFV